jgi:hypothetical protein
MGMSKNNQTKRNKTGIKHRHKKFWNKEYLIYLLPVAVLIAVLLFFESMFHYFDQSYYDAVFNQQVLKLNSIVGEIKQLREMGFTEDKDRQVYIEVLNMTISKIDSEEGIFARLLNLDFEVLSEVVASEKDRQPVSLFEQNNFHPDFPRIKQLMLENASGESTVTDNSYDMRIYWVTIPQSNPKYYIVVGVDSHYVLSNYKSFPFELGIFTIAILIMAMNYYILYLRTKLKQIAML